MIEIERTNLIFNIQIERTFQGARARLTNTWVGRTCTKQHAQLAKAKKTKFGSFKKSSVSH
jgi:hypothetical protein